MQSVSLKKLHSVTHTQVKTFAKGLVVSKDEPFLAASPDMLIKCKCHGQSLVEIKCPYKIRDQAPNQSNLPYLVEENNVTVLKKNHMYYFQVQAQLAVLKLKFCHFFVYTPHGHYHEIISFDEQLWVKILDNVKYFWINHVAPAIVSKTHTPASTSSGSDTEEDVAESITHNTQPSTSCPGCLTTNIMPTIYLCGACEKDCPSYPATFDGQSIECTGCHMWFHFRCVGIVLQDDFDDETNIWLCCDCVKTVVPK